VLKLKMARSACARARHRKNKKAGITRPFAIRYRISASTSVVKGNAELQPD
jgi:hypothetical protein